MSEDVQWARENMAARVANEEAQRRESGEDGANPEQSEGASSTPLNEQAANGEAGEANAGKTGARVPIKAANLPEGASGMMLRNQHPSVGDPGSAFGGNLAATCVRISSFSIMLREIVSKPSSSSAVCST